MSHSVDGRRTAVEDDVGGGHVGLRVGLVGVDVEVPVLVENFGDVEVASIVGKNPVGNHREVGGVPNVGVP